MSVRLLLAVALVAGAASGQGGPPFLTDDPGTPGDGVWEINLAVTLERGSDGSLLEAPLLDVNYGIGERLQAKVEVPWLLHLDGGVVGVVGNAEVGLKWRFLDDEDDGMDLSFYPQLEFEIPGSKAWRRGLTDSRLALLVPFQAQKRFGDFSLNAEVGFSLLEETENEWIAGLVAGWEVSEKLDLGLELHVTTEADLGGSEGVLNLGGRLALSEDVTLLATVGTGLWSSGGDTPDVLGYLGLQFTF